MIEIVLVLTYDASDKYKAQNLPPYKIYFLYKNLGILKEITDYLVLKISFS